MNNALHTRGIEYIRSYAALAHLMKHERKCKQPKSVEMFSIDEHEDLWGMSDRCLYRYHEGQCYRYPFDHDAFMSLHVLTRNKLPVSMKGGENYEAFREPNEPGITD